MIEISLLDINYMLIFFSFYKKFQNKLEKRIKITISRKI